ncbi:cell division protein ZipA [Acinetobacter gyllenbergii]|uniref:Cell division protein ZipA n=1 Tax=Acinetobacter gyllenbergii CIP 110306 = MTCC 11365 TaxID=1217657 RepID=A0A829HHD5_9GAMM|nr:cell division protein ZipA C-terminal FtsZ-binding domain-containing protein [Acinetobacter gyllenbergii]EPF77452.1 cell division protein ZipA [Acinetobacter gyllenbergii CIP 110306 = MTCC 11365]EPH33378.1 Cell division protein ZipA [Acinetobacter gyllenbergii CIP 110306 = MTCC 11365]GMA11250.1 cell division protein ZipA [Acinetobacter gyllenbergii]
MEMNTIIGIVAAVAIMLVGLIMILRKPKPVEPSLEADLHINPESQQPVIPRHVRDQLLQKEVVTTTERVEPSLNTEAIVVEPVAEQAIDATSVETKTTEIEQTAKADEAVETVVELEAAQKDQTATTEPETTVASENVEATEESKAETELSLNPNIETVAIEEFDGESNILDVHLHEQQRYDDESALATAEQIIALNVYPNPRRALSGDKALKVLLKYGLRFGEMSCFHRYENTDEPSALMFSVLRMTDNGPAGFDLETLSGEQVQGLAFFLALPNSKAVTGYDMMTSIAGLIAREVDGKVYDENNLEFTPQLKEHWRHHVIDYRPNQATV